MIATLGHFILFLALGVSLYAIAASIVGASPNRPEWLASSRNAVLALFCLVTVAIFLLEYALITSDFSLRYVANNSTRASQVQFKIAGLWGSLETQPASTKAVAASKPSLYQMLCMGQPPTRREVRAFARRPIAPGRGP